MSVLIRRTKAPVVSTIAKLKAVNKHNFGTILVMGYFAQMDGGGGEYFYDAADTTSADNYGSVIVAADGARWKLKHSGEVTAEQFGADGSYTVSASTRLQAMIDWCQENDVVPSLGTNKNYMLTVSLTLKHGRSASDTRSYHPRLKANSAALRPVGAFKGLHVVPRCLLADAPTGRGVAMIDVQDLRIDGYAATGACQAYVIGETGYACESFNYSSFGALVTGYTSNNAVQYLECRHIKSDLVLRSGTLLIEALATDSFTGDLIFNNFEANGTVAKRPWNITAGSGGTNAQVRGIRFITPTVYGTGGIISATGSGKVGDIWFISPQMDGPGAPAGQSPIELTANMSAEIFQVHIVDPYIVNFTGPAVKAQTNDAATIYQCDITGGGIGMITCDPANGNAAVYALNCENFAVESVDFDNIVGANASSCYVAIDGCTNVRVCDNTGTRSPSIVNGVNIGNGDRHIITGNMLNCVGQVVNDYTAGTPVRIVANNLKT